MWIDFINTITDTCKFLQPASEKDITDAEKVLNIELPEELKSLLTESNGIIGEYGIELVWTLGRIVQDNMSFRRSEDFKELYMPFDHLLFFADAGNGDQFAFPIHNGSITKDDIYVWNHEDDSRTWIASSLKRCIEGWLNGSISV